MQYVFPNYYNSFQCTASQCRHNCCIGWEIDIDPDTAAFYQTVSGEMGRRLQENISPDGQPHFILDTQERCPFLNKENLCDIILTLGEEHICDICTNHPRFHNELPGRLETGLGLCCEAAAQLILGQKEPLTLEILGDSDSEEEIIVFRDELISLLQSRHWSMERRILEMLRRCGAALPEKNLGQWVEIFLSLEHLEEKWTQLLTLLGRKWQQVDFSGFDHHMACRQSEYEQFLVYLVYRHLICASDSADLAARAAFAALGYALLRGLGAVIWSETGNFTFEEQAELARLFSSEIEYSEENLDILFTELSPAR